MDLTAQSALDCTRVLIGIGVLLESVELFLMRDSIAEDGVWRWSTIRADFEVFPRIIVKGLEPLLQNPGFSFLLFLRFLCAAAMLISGSATPLVLGFFLTVLVCLRWRGTVHGGSDFMTLILFAALSVASLMREHPKVALGCAWYISLQTCTSYFLAGIAKLRKPNWRTGKALRGFLSATIHGPVQIGKLALPASWAVMLFECLFPLALLNSTFGTAFIGAAFLFHVINAYVLGLNRFVFAWCAAYPALYYCSSLNS